MKKIDQLTSTRILASLLIVFHHLGAMEIPVLAPLVSLAVYAISFFFVLSGFVMTIVYFHPDRPFSFRDFWVARISRIFPVYLFSFALTCIYYADVLSKLKWSEYLASAFLLQAWIPEYALTMNFPAWTLVVEMFFYLIFPLVIYLFRRAPASRLIWASLIVWIFIQALRQIIIHGSFAVHANFVPHFPLFHMDAFLLGMAAGMWYLKVGRMLQLSQRTISVIMFSCLTFFLAMHFLGATQFFGSFHGFFSPLFAVIILMLTFDQSLVTRVLTWKPLVLLGESSYALYIIHVPLLWFFGGALGAFGLNPSPFLNFGMYLPLALLLSVLVFRLVEWPAQDWLRKNPQMLTVILIDAVLIVAAIALAYLARVGLNLRHYEREINFSIRAGLPLVIFSLILFRFYRPFGGVTVQWALVNLAAPLLLASAALWGALTVAKSAGWITSFPRTFLPINLVLMFGFLFLSRYGIKRWRPSWGTR
ncbi:MAG: acyltransferase family protein [Chloroflexi bacterium]|nr:acyltransferase family protein [Chloroflexota bacterium]